MSVQLKFAYHTEHAVFYENKAEAKQAEIDFCEAHAGDICLYPRTASAVLLASDDGGYTWYVVAGLNGPVNFVEVK